MTLERRVAAGDLIGILWEASEAYRAIAHGRSGIQLAVNPAEQAQRRVDAFAALTNLVQQHF